MMTLRQTAAAFHQQALGDGLEFHGFGPLDVEIPHYLIDGYRELVHYLRERVASSHPSRPDFDSILAKVAKTKLGPQERELVRRVGQPSQLVWVNASPFHFGRLEAVVPGIALVTVHPDPVLPEEPLARWEARTANALPFSVGLVELDHIDQVVSDGIADVLGVRRRPADRSTSRPRQGAESERAS